MKQEGKDCYSQFTGEELDVQEVDFWGGKDK